MYSLALIDISHHNSVTTGKLYFVKRLTNLNYSGEFDIF